MNTPATHGRGIAFATKTGAICCDVLDAWFDPSPHSINAFGCSGTSLRCSPDIQGAPLIRAIAKARNLDPECISLGAGSSEIIHRVLPGLLGPGPVVLLDPTYSEYSHVVTGSGRQIKRFALSEQNRFRVDLGLLKTFCQDATAVILVNPNNPTGQILTREEVWKLKSAMREDALLWVDEAYVDYCPSGTSVEMDAGSTPSLAVVKSLSKAYALSGIRAAYLVCSSQRSERIRHSTPPWIIGTSAQAAAIAALADPGYYRSRWVESQIMVGEFSDLIRNLGFHVYAGWINAALVRCPENRRASELANELAENGLMVRTPCGMGESLGEGFIRIGLVDRSLWPRLLSVLRRTLNSGPPKQRNRSGQANSMEWLATHSL